MTSTRQTGGAVISVFGSSAPQPGSAAYQLAYEVGRILAEHGFTVATGGYGGTMSAVSQGASEAGGNAIGVTCDQIEQFRPLGPNQWLSEEIRYASLEHRLIHLVRRNEGVIVLPGGIGTLSEMALTWSYLQVGEITPRPLVLLGEQWRKTISDFSDPRYVRPQHIALMYFASTAGDAVEHIVDFRSRELKKG